MHYRFPLIIAIILLSFGFRASFGQSSDEKVLREELKVKAKENKNSFDENLEELRRRGYPFQVWSESATNNDLKILLAMDDRLIAMQSELDSKLQNLKNKDLVKDMETPIRDARYEGSVDNDNEFPYVYKELTSRLSKVREQYTRYGASQGSSEINDWYLQQVLSFKKPYDERNIKLMEDRLLYRKQLYEQRDSLLAERKRKQDEYEKQRQQEILAEQEEERLAKEREQERNQKREAEIASLPSKAEIKAKFRTYKHKTGHIFEMFPVGFTPKPNKSTYDKVQIRTRIYTARYREHDEYGRNSLIIDFYDSGNISEAMVYNGDQLIYVAKYNDGATKPYEIYTKTPDDKFHLRIDRTYGDEEIHYYYAPLAYHIE